MNEFASLPHEDRAAYVLEAAGRMGTAAVIVEKDFWVCWMLARLFEAPAFREHLVFKGGTSLSKVFAVIDRFSEDVDLSLSQELLGKNEEFLEGAVSASQTLKRMREIERLCGEAVDREMRPVIETSVRSLLGPRPGGDSWLSYTLDPLTQSPVLTFTYPAAIDGGGAYVPQSVKMEFGSLTDQRPVGTHVISPMLATALPVSFDDFKAEVVALEVERTFWEKATILHAEYHRPAGLTIRDRFARHYYDFAALWRHASRVRAMNRLDLLERVAQHKSRFFASKWASYDTACPGSLKLVPPGFRMAELSGDYARMRAMILGEPPTFSDLMGQLAEAEREINST